MTVTVSEDYTASAQIGVDDLDEIVRLGFRSVMCNRPDGESPDQTPVEVIRAEAEKRGLAFSFVPVVSGAMTPEDVEAFQAEIGRLPTPVFAYCRSGARSQQLWRLANG